MTPTASFVAGHVEQTLENFAGKVDGRQIKLAFADLGKLCRSAWDGGGPELLASFLDTRSEASGVDGRVAILESLVRLGVLVGEPLEPLALHVRGLRSALDARLDVERHSQSTVQLSKKAPQNVEIARKRFVELAEAALGRARFGSASRRADLAHFEAFRFAYLAARADAEIGAVERRFLNHAGVRFQNHDDCLDVLYETLVEAVGLVGASVGGLTSRSLTLRLVRSNVSVRRELEGAALALIESVLALDGVTADEAAFLQDARRIEVAEVAAGAFENALIVVPRARSGLRADPVLDELFRTYSDHVPWRQ